jgi:UDPglucose 6-dehydrogenase
MSLRVSVIGLGYLGATHAVVMAQLGHQVIGIEPNPERLSALTAGRLPFYEPGLQEALTEALAGGRLKFFDKHTAESSEVDLHFICVGTPQLSGSQAADTRHLYAAISDLAPWIKPGAVVAGKSTVPVGTAASLRAELREKSGKNVELVWNPEFLREGHALKDSLTPDRIVVGISPETLDSNPEMVLRAAYSSQIQAKIPFLVVDLATSELVKVAANAFLATKISFINAVAEMAELTGADAGQLAEAIGFDERIGSKFLRNGIGFGGGCLPKDIHAFEAKASEIGAKGVVSLLQAVDSINLERRGRVVELAKEALGEITGKRIALLGAAFKAETDDIRESPALDVALALTAAGANVVVHDVMALDAVRAKYPELETKDELLDALNGADLTILATEWKLYRDLDPQAAASVVAGKRLIDGRNYLDLAGWQSAGWSVSAMGKGA